LMNTAQQSGGDPLQRLILELGRLPGVGERSAARLAFYIVRASHKAKEQGATPLALDLAEALTHASEQIQLCTRCQNLSAARLCHICRDHRRDAEMLCVVEGVADLRALESSGAYRGFYHVLHGVLSPLDGVGPDDLRLPELALRIQEQHIKEVILATNTDVEGDATAHYLARLLAPLGVRTTRLASGVPMGGELEFIDQATLSRALHERRAFA